MFCNIEAYRRPSDFLRGFALGLNSLSIGGLDSEFVSPRPRVV